jgi:hypothetical protein
LLYRPLIGGRRTAAAALLQATSLTFLVAATQIGRALGLMSAATAAALVAASLLSVLLFPLAALTLLRRAAPSAGGEQQAVPATERPALAADTPAQAAAARPQWLSDR